MLYNAMREAYLTGVSPLRPMYYEYPEEEMAYAASEDGSFAQYFFTSADVIAAPVVRKSTVLSTSQEYGGMAPKTIWLPPSSTWIEIPTGKARQGGSGVVHKLYDLTEIPIFVRLGALIPSTPRALGATIGMAQRLYEALTFSVYGISDSGHGHCIIYEDDGITTKYTSTKDFAETNATYTYDAATNATTLVVSPPTFHGTAATMVQRQSAIVPDTRTYTARFVNALPPTRVTIDGQPVAFSRYSPHASPSWWYEGDETTLVVTTGPRATNTELTIVAEGCYTASGVASVNALDGVKGKLRHAILAKANLDESRITPGAHTPYPGGALLSQAASTAESFSYLAHQSPAAFHALLSNFSSVFNSGVVEVQKIVNEASQTPAQLMRANYSLQMLRSVL
jgi:hypothetical protein